MKRSVTIATGAMVLGAATLALAPPASAASPACDTRVNNTFDKLLECVTLDGVREHQAAFQDIADANGGNRFSGLPGHDGSVDYVVQPAHAPPATPRRPAVRLPGVRRWSGPSALQQTAPGPVTYVEGVDFGVHRPDATRAMSLRR